MSKSNPVYQQTSDPNNSWNMNIGNGDNEDLNWLL